MKMTDVQIQSIMQGGFSNLADPDARGFLEGGRDPDRIRDVYERDLDTFEMAKKFHRTFSTGDGAEVLAHLKSATLERVQFNPSAENPSEDGFFKSGEANIVIHIIRMMESAEKGPPPLPQELMVTPEGDEE